MLANQYIYNQCPYPYKPIMKTALQYPTIIDQVELNVALCYQPLLARDLKEGIAYFAKRAANCRAEHRPDYRMIGKILRLELAALEKETSTSIET